MFGWDQKERLLRESWTADSLAQELYAMFGENVPNTTAAPVVINNGQNKQQAPLVIQNFGPNQQLLNFTKKDGSQYGTVSFINGKLVFTSATGQQSTMCCATKKGPTITNVSPSVGNEFGGTTVTITGTNLQGAVFNFGANPATVISNNGTTAVVKSPAGSPGRVDITAVTSAGTSPINPFDGFVYNTIIFTAGMGGNAKTQHMHVGGSATLTVMGLDTGGVSRTLTASVTISGPDDGQSGTASSTISTDGTVTGGSSNPHSTSGAFSGISYNNSALWQYDNFGIIGGQAVIQVV